MDRASAQRLLWERREDLTARRDGLAQELGTSQLEMTQELSSYDNHPADLASETFEREKDLGLYHDLRERVRAVDAALHRLDEGTYGLCAHCGHPIGDARLQIIPEAEQCYQCQRAWEARAARRQRPVEEDVLDPTFRPRRTAGYDEVDVWEDVAQHGTAYSPQDQPGAEGFADIHREEEADDGTVEPVEGLPRR